MKKYFAKKRFNGIIDTQLLIPFDSRITIHLHLNKIVVLLDMLK